MCMPHTCSTALSIWAEHPGSIHGLRIHTIDHYTYVLQYVYYTKSQNWSFVQSMYILKFMLNVDYLSYLFTSCVVTFMRVIQCRQGVLSVSDIFGWGGFQIIHHNIINTLFFGSYEINNDIFEGMNFLIVNYNKNSL